MWRCDSHQHAGVFNVSGRGPVRLAAVTVAVSGKCDPVPGEVVRSAHSRGDLTSALERLVALRREGRTRLAVLSAQHPANENSRSVSRDEGWFVDERLGEVR